MALTKPSISDSRLLSLSTNVVFDDEPCFELAEVNKVLPMPVHAGGGLRRFQVIRVIRGDRIWEHLRDMGPASAFKTEPFLFPGAVSDGSGRWNVLETVGRLKDAAENFRVIQNGPGARGEPLDLVKGFEETATRRWEARKGTRKFAMNGSRT